MTKIVTTITTILRTYCRALPISTPLPSSPPGLPARLRALSASISSHWRSYLDVALALCLLLINVLPTSALTAYGQSTVCVGECPTQSTDWPFDESDNDNLSFTSCYDYRHHPKTGEWHLHSGIDIGAGKHNYPPVYSLSNGTVTGVNRTFSLGQQATNSYGNYVIILDEKNVQHLYGHLLDVEEKLDIGDAVKVGQLIGHVDSTGTSTGNHLHYEVRTQKEANGNYSSTNPCCGYLDCNKVGGEECSCKEPLNP